MDVANESLSQQRRALPGKKLYRWRGGRVVEGARLESVYTLIAYRGFESLSLRHVVWSLRSVSAENF